MRDQLLDIVKHTRGYGFIDEIKVIAEEDTTDIMGYVEGQSVMFKAEFHKVIPELKGAGVFGMPNLSKLSVIVNIPEYAQNAKIELMTHKDRGATGLHFENESGDFKNDYRFQGQALVDQRIKNFSMSNVDWDVEFTPTSRAVKKLKMQIAANSEAETFKVHVDEENNLVFSFGELETHAGNFVFEPNVKGSLKRTWAWPVDKFSKVFDLGGEQSIHISDRGLVEIRVNSGQATYHYYLPGIAV